MIALNSTVAIVTEVYIGVVPCNCHHVEGVTDRINASHCTETLKNGHSNWKAGKSKKTCKRNERIFVTNELLLDDTGSSCIVATFRELRANGE